MSRCGGRRLGCALAILALTGACSLPGSGGRRVFESSWRLGSDLPEARETEVATWVLPGRLRLRDRLLQISGRFEAHEGVDLPREVIVRVEIADLTTGRIRKRYRQIVDRSPEDGFRRAKKFPKSVSARSTVTLTVEPVGAALAAGTGVLLCLDLVGKRNQLDGFPSCAAGGEATALSGIQLGVFSGRCASAGCHDSVTAERGLVLESGRSFESLVDVPASQSPGQLRVRPGDPDRSYLVQKLRGTNSIGGRMPLGGPFLTDAQIAGVVEWIEQGARDN